MGMAASQARYLALVARKSNCEYEGQQINQARTALSNQSANLFNQMLGLSVPIPPSTQDFTKTQYSFTDGLNGSTIDSWQQLAETDENYNYVVTHHYYTDVYTGSQKKLSDPQVQFSSFAPTESLDYYSNVTTIQDYKNDLDAAQNAYDEAKDEYLSLKSESETLVAYRDKNVFDAVTNCAYNEGTKTYTITNTKNATTTTGDFVKYADLAAADKNAADAAIATWNEMLATDVDPESLLYNKTDGTFIFASDLANLPGYTGGSKTNIPVYHISGTDPSNQWYSIQGIDTALTTAESAMNTAKINLGLAQNAYDALNIPEYIGNCELTNLNTLTKDQEAEIAQIVKDMEAQGVDASICKYYDPDTGKYNGGIYSFNLNGITYYTTYDDLAESATSGSGINNIDGQFKLAYYNADYVSTKIEKTEKALLETDGTGRFSTIRLEDDSVTYTLKMETITDNEAYEDAMNQYYYENAVYDKTIQDINAKTSIIQQQDQQLELKLKQLETEHSALSSEIDAVQKVVKDNVDKSFKTFGG